MQALVLRKLHKIYSNTVVALDHIDLVVEEGDFFGLLGQNGAGKSTAIGIVSALVKKTSGMVSVFGYDIDTHLAQAKSLIGIVPQELNFSLFEKAEQILVNQAGYYGIPRRIALARAEQYLVEIGLWEKRHLPAFRLSGGMKRRLMIARAMMNQPKLLILDEPTAGVDIEIRRTLWQFLKTLNDSGTTIILTTHYLEEAELLCKHIAILHRGKIIAHDRTKALIHRLTKQTLIFELASPVMQMPILPGFFVNPIDSTTLEVEIAHGQSMNELLRLMANFSIPVVGMRNKSNRLEELFMTLVQK